MNINSLSTNNNLNLALINIIKIIKNIKFEYKFSNKETALKLGLMIPIIKNDHIVSYSVKYKLDDYVFSKLEIYNATKCIHDNLSIIYKIIIHILSCNNGITQVELSKKLEINKNFDINNWITYLFVELLNDIKIVTYTKINNKKIYLTNNMSSLNLPHINKHSSFIDKRINDYKNQDKYNINIHNNSHENIIKTFSNNIFTNLIHDTFTKAYVNKFNCEDCGKKSTDRCHGIGQERPVLLKLALQKIYPDTTKSINLQTIVFAFLEEHKYTNFTFKCNECHKKEKRYI